MHLDVAWLLHLNSITGKAAHTTPAITILCQKHLNQRKMNLLVWGKQISYEPLCLHIKMSKYKQSVPVNECWVTQTQDSFENFSFPLSSPHSYNLVKSYMKRVGFFPISWKQFCVSISKNTDMLCVFTREFSEIRTHQFWSGRIWGGFVFHCW